MGLPARLVNIDSYILFDGDSGGRGGRWYGVRRYTICWLGSFYLFFGELLEKSRGFG